MYTLIAVTIVGYIIFSIVVGISYFSLFGKRIGVEYNRKAFLLLLVIFAVLDLYWLPPVAALDITVTFGNKEMASAFEAESGIRVNDFLEVGWSDAITWLLQTVLAYFVGLQVYSQILRRGLTSNSS
ncbi:MAG: hypothetical protein KIT50_13475 [Bacteroidetes bacterium]|nr:hypothetical protein [Bacteroidota bacterium]